MGDRQHCRRPGRRARDRNGPWAARKAEGKAHGSSTVLPLFKKFLLITLIIMLALIFLSSLGIDIGPLIAGAGIIGIAIGFGAQTLVKDIVSGLFFLLDDAFRVGEYVTTGEHQGHRGKNFGALAASSSP